MGYSTPKKQLDLKEFLSTPAKKKPFVRNAAKARPRPEAEAETGAESGAPAASPGTDAT
ncbi:hypothetical protein [Frigidibacter sp. MR17.24]|uniref:hypothetical protein n=1 Tax=Frigidibacter sp. MR17.24 TaxID=3127345 RepID=UPI003012DBCF